MGIDYSEIVLLGLVMAVVAFMVLTASDHLADPLRMCVEFVASAWIILCAVLVAVCGCLHLWELIHV